MLHRLGLRARLSLWLRQTLFWKITLELVLRRRGIFVMNGFPGDVSSDLSVEPPVGLGKVSVGPGVRIGKYSYVNSGMLWGNISIGRFCSIGDNVIIAPVEHPATYFSTYDDFYKNTGYYRRDLPQRRTIIGNDVWIGANVLVKRGVRVEDGAVIAAGAVVVKDVPAYSVVGGAPANVIKYRFDEDQIRKLVQLKWWNLSEDVLKNLPFDDVEECIRILEQTKKA
jgi:acetyltransferase-like isoleucine patch superfamily enzyme